MTTKNPNDQPNPPKIQNFKGTKDYPPSEMILRHKLIQQIQKHFENYGFVPIQTPAIEYLDLLTDKYGENEKLIYPLQYKGGKTAGLRYDLTVPLARFIQQHQNDLIMPWKRYQIQPVWRGDRPQIQQGRLREFYQCDADIVGSDSLLADAEIIALQYDLLKNIDIGPFVIQFNHRKILQGIIEFLKLEKNKETTLCQSLDKWDKIGQQLVEKELTTKGFTKKHIENLRPILNIQNAKENILPNLEKALKTSKSALEGIKELKQILEYTKALQIPQTALQFKLTLARGLNYYTGTIYESESLKYPNIGSLGGGGRYDNLIKRLGKKSLQAVGATLGLERIITILKKRQTKTPKDSLTEILITRFENDNIQKKLTLASELRNAGFKTEIFYKTSKISKQLHHANKRTITYVLILGPEEAKNNQISIKNLKTCQQKTIDQTKLIQHLK